jgi:hypothetical protein
MADAIDDLLSEDRKAGQLRADEFLAGRSWDRTFREMWELIKPFTRDDAKDHNSYRNALTAIKG